MPPLTQDEPQDVTLEEMTNNRVVFEVNSPIYPGTVTTTTGIAPVNVRSYEYCYGSGGYYEIGNIGTGLIPPKTQPCLDSRAKRPSRVNGEE